MIDIHVHILPATDDGAKDVSMSLEMAQAAVKSGVTHVCATPHFYSIPSWVEIKNRCKALQNQLKQAGIDLTIVPSSEIHSQPEIENLKPEEIPTYNDHGKHCLLEFPFRQIPIYASNVIFSLLVKGITPIIAHAECYSDVVNDPNLVLDWIDKGCLIQVNCGSLLGAFGENIRKTAYILLEHDMVHFLASDAHSNGTRFINLAEGREAALKTLSEQEVQALVVENPRKVINGLNVDVRDPKVYKPKKKRFWLF